jgi:hypothetical protein
MRGSRAGQQHAHTVASRLAPAVAGSPVELDRERIVLCHTAALPVHRAQQQAPVHQPAVAGSPVKLDRERVVPRHAQAHFVRHTDHSAGCHIAGIASPMQGLDFGGLGDSRVHTENEAENDESTSEHRIPLAGVPSRRCPPSMARGARVRYSPLQAANSPRCTRQRPRWGTNARSRT